MPEQVERFSVLPGGPPIWVRHADHTAAIAAKDEEIERQHRLRIHAATAHAKALAMRDEEIERLKDRIEDLCLGRFDSAGNDEIDVQKTRADKAEQAAEEWKDNAALARKLALEEMAEEFEQASERGSDEGMRSGFRLAGMRCRELAEEVDGGR